jgi:hypothetical protein
VRPHSFRAGIVNDRLCDICGESASDRNHVEVPPQCINCGYSYHAHIERSPVLPSVCYEYKPGNFPRFADNREGLEALVGRS